LPEKMAAQNVERQPQKERLTEFSRPGSRYPLARCGI
jgi:hypothetical protein